MKVHLRQIPNEGLHVEGEEDCPIPQFDAEEVRCAGAVHYALDLGISEGALWANGKLTQPVELRCVRCLETFPFQIEVNDFAVHVQLVGPEEIDLTPFMREDILLNLPAYPHCGREGDRKCKAKIPRSEEASANRKPDWSPLDKLEL